MTRQSALLSLLFLAACGVSNDPTATTAQAVCGQPTVRGTAMITFTDGSCRAWSVQSWPDWHIFVPTANQGLFPIAHVDTAPGTAVWVCDAANPLAQQTPSRNWAGCWNGGQSSGFPMRVRGAYLNGGFVSGHVDITRNAGRSFILSYWGTLPAPPSCPYVTDLNRQPPTHEHACNTLGDDSFVDVTQNNDPSDSTSCCNVSGLWPDGNGFGAPCTAHTFSGDYGVVNYACPVY